MKKTLLMVLAGVSLIACQKANEELLQGDGTQKVSITIQNEQISRSVLNEPVNGGAITTLRDGKLFFFDAAGTTVHTYELTAANIAASTTPFIVGVPAAAKSVAMLANYKGYPLADEDPYKGDLEDVAPATFDAFKLLKYGIENQAKMAGEDGVTASQPNAVQGIALLDTLGTNGAVSPLKEEAGDGYTHKAAITLVPAVSRIEIAEGAIKVASPNTTNLTGFNFTGIYVNNYSANYALGLAQDAALLGSTITGGGLPNWVASYKGLSPAPSTHLYAEPASAAVSTTTGIGGYAFHVFPGKVPHIILRGANFAYTGVETVAGPLFWRIEKYWEATDSDEKSTTEITEFKPGHVYKIASIEVGNSHPGDDPYDKAVSVQVTLTVQPWQDIDVFVEPE